MASGVVSSALIKPISRKDPGQLPTRDSIVCRHTPMGHALKEAAMDPKQPYWYLDRTMLTAAGALAWMAWYILTGIILPPRKRRTQKH